MRQRENAYLRQAAFARVLAEVEAKAPLDLRSPGLSAADFWPPAAGSPEIPQFFTGEAVEDLYAEAQEVFLPSDEPVVAAQAKAADAFAELESCGSLDELSRLRRRAAFAAHPDRVAPQQRESAEKRMAELNAAIDRAMAAKRA